MKDVTAAPSVILHKDLQGKEFHEKWNYRRIRGKLNFLEKSTRPYLAYAVHQCARFQANRKESHAKAITHIGRYLLPTRDKGLVLRPTDDLLQCYSMRMRTSQGFGKGRLQKRI